MGKRTIKLTVENEYVRGAGVPVGAAGSHDEVELVVTFVGDVWLGTNKYVTFRDALGQSPRLKMLLDSESVIELSEGGDGATIQKHKVTVPYAAKTHAGNMSVTFTGYTVLSTSDAEENLVFYEGECINTMTAYFRVLPSDYVILEDGSFESEQGATLAQQVQDAFFNFTSKFDGEDGLIAQANAATSEAQQATSEAQQAITEMTKLANEAQSNALTAATEAAEAAASAEQAKESAEVTAALAGNIDAALDSIIVIQNSLIGGDVE